MGITGPMTLPCDHKWTQLVHRRHRHCWSHLSQTRQIAQQMLKRLYPISVHGPYYGWSHGNFVMPTGCRN